jgi:hypothetical protein
MAIKTQSCPDPIKWGEVTFGDTTVTIYATEVKRDGGINGNEGITGVEFTLEVDSQGDVSGGSLLGFFIDFDDPVKDRPIIGDVYSGDGDDTDKWLAWSDEGVLYAGNRANNMNGTAANDSDRDPNDPFDIGVQLSDVGTADGNLESTTFTIYGFSLEDLDGQTFGLRLQNTPNAEGSLKLVGTFIKPDCPSGLLYQGFTRGSWLNGARSNDLDDLLASLFGEDTPNYEKLIFDGPNDAITFISEGVNGGTFTDPTLREALGLTGGKNNQLAAQSTAAYLNALYLGYDGESLGYDKDPVTAYRLSTGQIKAWTAAALTGKPVDLSGYSWYIDTNDVKGFQEAGVVGDNGDLGDTVVSGSAEMGINDLTNLFDFYNNFGTDPAAFMLNPCPQPLVV